MTRRGGRRSQASARERWLDLRPFTGGPLGVGLAVVGLWPAVALVHEWARYDDPLVALGVYLASLALVAALWWRGPAGLSLLVAVASGVAVVVLDLTLALQIAPGEPYGAALWMTTWSAAVPMLLAFARPVEEPLAILLALVATNTVAVLRADHTVEALHTAPLPVGIPLAVSASGLALVGALRGSAANARHARARAEAVAERRRVVEAVENERASRVAGWADGIAPLLEDLAGSRRSARDPGVGASCRRLAAALRTDLGSASESILVALLPASEVALTVHDQDVGHRLVEADRIALVARIRGWCAAGPGGALQVTLLPDGPETSATAVVVVAADGVPAPGERSGATLVVESPTRWWWDATLHCEPAPALVAQGHLTRAADLS